MAASVCKHYPSFIALIHYSSFVIHAYLYLRCMAIRTVIRSRLHVLAADTESIFQTLQDMPPEYHGVQPAPGSWSVLQAANHVYQAEKFSLQYLRHKLKAPEDIPGYRLSSWWRLWLMVWTLRSPLRFKAPPAVDMHSGQPVLPAGELHAQWQGLRSELTTLLYENEENLRRKLTYKHHIAGRLTLHQMLIFLHAHLRHHLRQIRRIRRIWQDVS